MYLNLYILLAHQNIVKNQYFLLFVQKEKNCDKINFRIDFFFT
jgi:hypothetical protein